ncbi:hypothetical protein D9758_004477 [Tetrapyrgos nigripes]|uniref:F-box domain-containing protein n=1 Tax=Tetrapyrgos nigripes TaxID=182062 RepID=A0A8H5GNH9_9AGAR|nr:hypothetical protein D9758_004477 [Tetrapyrgos nigripes]
MDGDSPSFHTTMTFLTFLDLPTEILIQILSYLPALDIASISFCSHFLCDVVKNSVELQYIIHLHIARSDDNPQSRMLFGEKLALLTGREKGWATLVPDFVRVVEVPFEPGSIYDLSADVYLLGDSSRSRLYYLPLPSSPEDKVAWKTLVGPEGKQIVDFAINLYEHDLIVLVAAPQRTFLVQQQSTVLIELQLRKFSTNTPHPLAKQPIIPLVTADRQWGHPAINMEIVGDYLTVVTSFWRVVRSRCTISVYEWKTGRVVMASLNSFRPSKSPQCFLTGYLFFKKIDGRPESYSGVIYVTETLILLPNLSSRELEVWKIPTSEEEKPPTKPLLCLRLPLLAAGCFYDLISCRAEPNPIHSTPSPETRNKPSSSDAWYSSKPFHPRPDDSVILLHIRVIANGVIDPPSDMYTLFIHRAALVRLAEYELLARKELKQQQLLELSQITPLPVIDSVLEQSAEAERWGQARAYTDFADIRTQHEKFREEPDPKVYDWQDWGVPHSFMINSGMGSESRWITTSCGGRFVLLVPYENRRRRAVAFPKVVGWEGLEGIEELERLEELTSPKRKRRGEDGDDDDMEGSGDGSDEEEDEDEDKDDSEGKTRPSRILVFDFNPHHVREAVEKPMKGRVVIKPKPGSQAAPQNQLDFHITLSDIDEAVVESLMESDEEYHPVHNPTFPEETWQELRRQQLQQLIQQHQQQTGGAATGAWTHLAALFGLNDAQDLEIFWARSGENGEAPRKDTLFTETVESRLPCVITVATTMPLPSEAEAEVGLGMEMGHGGGSSAYSYSSGSSAGPSVTRAGASTSAIEEGSVPVLDVFNDADGLLADDERIIGVKTGVFSRIASVSIAHFSA